MSRNNHHNALSQSNQNNRKLCSGYTERLMKTSVNFQTHIKLNDVLVLVVFICWLLVLWSKTLDGSVLITIFDSLYWCWKKNTTLRRTHAYAFNTNEKENAFTPTAAASIREWEYCRIFIHNTAFKWSSHEMVLRKKCFVFIAFEEGYM